MRIHRIFLRETRDLSKYIDEFEDFWDESRKKFPHNDQGRELYVYKKTSKVLAYYANKAEDYRTRLIWSTVFTIVVALICIIINLLQ